MNKKHFLWVLWVSLCFFWYTVAGLSFYKNSDINFLWTSAWNVYIWSDEASKVIVSFSANTDLSSYSIANNCGGKTRFVWEKNKEYRFEFSLNPDCTNNQFYLQDEDENLILNTNFSLVLKSDGELYNLFTDYTNELLKNASKKLDDKIQTLKIFLKADPVSAPLSYLKKLHQLKEYEYQKEKITEILQKRQGKYSVPVVGRRLPDGSNPSKFPNGWRPYRAAYTNGIHEGFDIDAPNHSQVVALDDGVIVRIISGWKFEDLGKLVKWENISYANKLENLNILRGNQVWLKTMKWDVAFYSHLDSIETGLKVGQKVKKWQNLGKTWITWVPDKEYADYHLHLELKKNPYIKSKAGNYTFYDYMDWDWYFKGMTAKQILLAEYNYFE